MFATDWILTLFSSLIPFDIHQIFLTNFLKEGWSYFYNVVLTFLKEIQTDLLEQNEFGDVLITLKKFATPDRGRPQEPDHKESFLEQILSKFKAHKDKIDWKIILQKA